ncbi:hypothetical protein [Candidatus Phycosocius spiralis]|uniref:DUF1311 domain-containing protein n=1 Tax=Candidatus Phycosocius spiralis TaxID=2815099 RepID=A0ABQ4PYE6_9PROT|nr:hypothetical protein [Candidatus Phycosocius spiralis]GIU68038.1 hypothetical protein PsB1_2192 [Candidatus Phycosocius spiralis]
MKFPLIHLGLALLFSGLLLFSSLAYGQVTGLERSYAQRAAMRAIDLRCGLLQEGPRRALNGFAAQARGAALRAGSSTQKLDQIEGQAQQAMAGKACNDPTILAEAKRVIAAHKGWRSQLTAVYSGMQRSWQVDRSGKDIWRAYQDIGGLTRAGLVTSSSGLSFAVETPDVQAAGARLFLRDANKVGPPSLNRPLTPPPRSGTKVYVAAQRQAAASRSRLEQNPRAGTLFLFSDATTRALLYADPRDTFEIELTSRSGQVTRSLVEVGDFVAAYTFAAEF